MCAAVGDHCHGVRRAPSGAIRAALGDDWWAEPWDRNWTKIYTAFYYRTLDDQLLEETAARLAEAISVMQPIFRLVYKRK